MPRTSRPTKPSPPKLSEVANHLSVPADIVGSEWPAVHRTCRDKLGITFDHWQQQAGRLILTKRADGLLATTIDGVGMSLPRQVGKTYLLAGMLFALCVNRPGLLVIWSAHHARTHGETFLAMQGFAQRGKVAPHIRQVFTGSGAEEIRFHNGSRILFGARERGFGRGIPGVDVLVMDEAQILSDKAMSNMLATLNTSHFGLHIYIGTPPKPEDMSEAFTRMRREALAGTLRDGAWIEFGADRDAKPEDRKQWAKANPSYPHRTPAQSMIRLRRKLTDADWRREGLGIWDDDAELISRVIMPDEWSATATETQVSPDDPGIPSMGVKFSPDGSRVAVAGAFKRGDSPIHVELIDKHTGSMAAGIASLASWIAERASRYAAIVIDGKSNAGALVDLLLELGVTKRAIVVPTWPEVATANAMLVEGVIGRRVTHLEHEGQALLDLSVERSEKKSRPDGSWNFVDPTGEGAEVPIQAVALAHWGAKTSKRKPGRKLTAGGMM